MSTVASISSTQVAMGESGIIYSFEVSFMHVKIDFSFFHPLPPSFSLKPLDIEFMKQLHNLVNIVPVIGKADTLTAAELKKFKVKVQNIEYIMFPFFRCLLPNEWTQRIPLYSNLHL